MKKLEPIVKEKYDYFLLDKSVGDFNTEALKLQNDGYQQQGLPHIYTNKYEVTCIKLMFRKLIYEAEYYNNRMIREYNY